MNGSCIKHPPIITLASISQIGLLKKFYDNVHIPQAVYDEIRSKQAYGYREIEKSFFEVHTIKDTLAQNLLLNDLDLGEAQAIVLAKELDAEIVFIDETIGFQIARSQALNVKRTLSLLIAAKQKGYIDAVKPLLEEMVSKNRWISRRVCQEILKLCNE